MKSLPQLLNSKNFIMVDDCQDAIELIERLSNIYDPDMVFFDFETTGTNPFAEGFEVLSVAFALDETSAWFLPLGLGRWNDAERMTLDLKMTDFLLSQCPKVAQNIAYEDLVARVKYTHGKRVVNWYYDTMVGAHVADERRGTTGLDFQCFAHWGESHKGIVEVAKLRQAPLPLVAEYNTMDVRVLPILMDLQDSRMSTGQAKAYNFFHGCLGDMIDAQWVGLRVDFEELGRFETQAKERLAADKERFESHPIIEDFRRQRGRNPKPSGDDAIELIYRLGSANVIQRTENGKPAMDSATLGIVAEDLDTPQETADLIEVLGNISSYEKLLSTYCNGLRELADKNGVIHPSFMLHTTETYRSSSADPNFQNFPARDDFGALIRRCLKPVYPFDLLLEGDVKGSELAVSAMLSGDEVMMDEVRRDFDIHRYWASILLEKDEDKITKAERYIGKNGMIFPLLYGSYYVSIAKATGLPERRVKMAEERFWKRYKATKRWQREQIEFYKKNLYVETPLGFRRHAPLSNNQIINSPIQATSFHLLLAGIHKVNAELNSGRWDSKLCGQIHDSAYFATKLDGEANALLKMANAKMTEIHYGWQRLPVSIEWMAGTSMGSMKELSL